MRCFWPGEPAASNETSSIVSAALLHVQIGTDMTDPHSNADTATGSQKNTGATRRFFWVGMAVFLIVMVFLGFGSTSLFAQDDPSLHRNWSERQANVWEKEKEYWKVRKAADFEGFMSLWDERFVGWSGPGIITRSDLKTLVEKEFASRAEELRYELKPRAVRVFNQTAVTFYSVVFQNEEGKTVRRTRFHHMWRKQDGTWKIASGMSAPPLQEEE